MASAVMSKAAFADHLAALGIRPGIALAVHARLLSFGRLEGNAATAYHALANAVGPEGTLAFPTYTLDGETKRPFDPADTPAPQMGALSEYVRQRPEALRTPCPLHSHAVVGPGAAALMAADANRSFGPRSVFDVMLRARFDLLLLGCTVHEGATFVHHVEADVGVPYRAWITFDRRVRAQDGAIQTVSYSYYSRRTDMPVHNNLNRADAVIRGLAEAIVVPVGSRTSLRVPLEAVDRAVRGLLAQDPFALVDCLPSDQTIAHAG